MDTSLLVAVLALGTLGAVVVFAVLSKNRVSQRRRSHRQKSTLAADTPSVTPSGVKPVDT